MQAPLQRQAAVHSICVARQMHTLQSPLQLHDSHDPQSAGVWGHFANMHVHPKWGGDNTQKTTEHPSTEAHGITGYSLHVLQLTRSSSINRLGAGIQDRARWWCATVEELSSIIDCVIALDCTIAIAINCTN